QSAQDLSVPYEWYEPAKVGSEKSRHVLVVWLTDDAFRDAPIARLADFISWFRLGCARSWGNPEERKTVRWPLALRVGHC
ncbi:MAG: hypothetical protein WCE49_16285, partial [Terrimicrobiaceae bacterium]